MIPPRILMALRSPLVKPGLAKCGLVIDGSVGFRPANWGQQKLAGRKILVGNGVQAFGQRVGPRLEQQRKRSPRTFAPNGWVPRLYEGELVMAIYFCQL